MKLSLSNFIFPTTFPPTSDIRFGVLSPRLICSIVVVAFILIDFVLGADFRVILGNLNLPCRFPWP